MVDGCFNRRVTRAHPLVLAALAAALVAACGDDSVVDASAVGSSVSSTSTASSTGSGAGGGGASTGATSSRSGSGGDGGDGGQGGEGPGGAGGTGGGPVCTPEARFDGPPIDAPLDTWTWVEVPGAVCRDGSPTGFGVRLSSSSDRLVIYLEGGGACFNNETCTHNPSTFGEADFASWASGSGSGGIFDGDHEDNPFAGDNVVYVPYCTGDVHAGNQVGVDVPGLLSPQDQSFVGYANIGLYLERIVPTFEGASRVVLSGSSAGGFGALFNYDRVAQAFCPTVVVLLDDSGPPLADETMAPCLQTRWRTLWGLDETLPADCAACSGQPDGGGLVSAVGFLGAKYPEARLGLVSYEQDAVISLFFGYGKNECLTLDAAPVTLTGPEYAAALAALRAEHLEPSAPWSSYVMAGSLHTVLGGDAFYTAVAGDVPLTQWVDALLEGAPPGHVGP